MIVQHWFKMTTKRLFNSKRIFHRPGTIVLSGVALVDQVDCRMDAQRRIQMQFDQVRSRSKKKKRLSCFEFRVHRILLVKKLQQLHDKHLTRPDFDENSSEEKEIESITKDMTTVRSLWHFEMKPVLVFRRCWMDVMHLFNNWPVIRHDLKQTHMNNVCLPMSFKPPPVLFKIWRSNFANVNRPISIVSDRDCEGIFLGNTLTLSMESLPSVSVNAWDSRGVTEVRQSIRDHRHTSELI